MKKLYNEIRKNFKNLTIFKANKDLVVLSNNAKKFECIAAECTRVEKEELEDKFNVELVLKEDGIFLLKILSKKTELERLQEEFHMFKNDETEEVFYFNKFRKSNSNFILTVARVNELGKINKDKTSFSSRFAMNAHLNFLKE